VADEDDALVADVGVLRLRLVTVVGLRALYSTSKFSLTHLSVNAKVLGGLAVMVRWVKLPFLSASAMTEGFGKTSAATKKASQMAKAVAKERIAIKRQPQNPKLSTRGPFISSILSVFVASTKGPSSRNLLRASRASSGFSRTVNYVLNHRVAFAQPLRRPRSEGA
jgi:hypothetical protein